MSVFFSVSGSWGVLIVDAVSGTVMSYDAQGNKPDAGEKDYSDIIRFDIDEWTRHYNHSIVGRFLDILDIGFWTKTGEYEAPESEWRARHASDIR